MKKKVVIGLSGGVDSSVAAYLLQQDGYEVIGMFMRNWHDTTGTLAGDCPWYDDQVFAELTAKKLDIPFHTIDLSDQYRARVVDYMFSEYGKGRTPNPDVLCNREIKFDAFLKAALDLGADYVATGHYCRREDIEVDVVVRHRLLAGLDPGKDQSYFLCQLTQQMLSKSLFPIGHLLKSEVRAIASQQGLATAERKDSQGICFVGKVDLPVFLQQKLEAKSGDIIEIPSSWSGYSPQSAVGEVGQNLTIEQLRQLAAPYRYSKEDGARVGEHRGAHFFTIGQRKGINVGGKPEPLFVIATDVERNILYVGQGENHRGLYRRGLHILPQEMHWIRPDLAFGGLASHTEVCGARHTDNGCNLHTDSSFTSHTYNSSSLHTDTSITPQADNSSTPHTDINITPRAKTCCPSKDTAAAIPPSRPFSIRIRYRQPLQQGRLYSTPQGGFVVFDNPQRGVTAGQFCAWYYGEELVGSGVINE